MFDIHTSVNAELKARVIQFGQAHGVPTIASAMRMILTRPELWASHNGYETTQKNVSRETGD